MYVLLAFLLLGILVTVHEFGHFIFARMTGIEVMEFSIGFGPKLLGGTTRSGTKLSLRLIPLGGYCAFYDEDVDKGDPRSFRRQKVWKRMLSVLMGPGMNFILALVVAIGYFWCNGAAYVTGYTPYLSEVEVGRPAYEAGIQAGDKICTVNGINVLDGTMDTLIEALDSYHEGDAPLKMTIDRNGEIFETEMTPFYDTETESHRIGVTISALADYEYHPCTLTEACSNGFQSCVYAGRMIFDALGALVTRGEGLESTAGPVGIISTVSVQIEQNGLQTFFDLLVILSINLGIMNLLPFPGLDGSRLVFLLIEGVFRKPVNPEIEAKIHFAGLVLLLALIAVITVRDIIRLF